MNYSDAVIAFLAGFFIVHLMVLFISFITWENTLKFLGYGFVFRTSLLIGAVVLVSYMVKT